MARMKRAQSQEINRRLLALYADGLGCRQIGARTGISPVVIYKRLRRLGKIRTKRQASDQQAVQAPELPFKKPSRRESLRNSAIGIAMEWFLSRGYVPSLPVQSTFYDLIVESDRGLQRIQVKTTTAKERSGSWSVSVSRKSYRSEQRLNAAGKRRQVVYTRDQVDLFFIVTGDGSLYLVPIELTGGAQTLCLDNKYKRCLLSDEGV